MNVDYKPTTGHRALEAMSNFDGPSRWTLVCACNLWGGRGCAIIAVSVSRMESPVNLWFARQYVQEVGPQEWRVSRAIR